MRQETQHYQTLKLQAEIVLLGVGQTGLTVTALVKRIPDGLWLQAAGGWGASPDTITLPAVDASNLPGFYAYDVPGSDGALLDSGGSPVTGYQVKIIEATNNLLEYVHINPTITADDGVRMLSLRQHNMRFHPTFWDATTRQPTAGKVWIYPDKATLIADATPDGTGAIGEYTVAATFNGSGQLTGYTSVMES